MIKETLAVASLGAVIALGALMGTGTANANEGSFVYAANNEGGYDTNTGATMRFGHQVSNLLYSGYSEATGQPPPAPAP